jgi:regulator of sigma E protease
MGLFVALLVLSLLVFFHELGHFSVARFFGVHIEVFSIGFGKKIASYQWGDTEWRFSMIPLGGYVKMKGQEDINPLTRSNDADSYNSQAPYKRLLILLGGPLANFLIAFILFIIIALMGTTSLKPIVGGMIKDSPAVLSGLQVGDEIKSINKVTIKSWGDLSKAIGKTEGNIELYIHRLSTLHRIIIKPEQLESKTIFGETVYRRMIGISPDINQTYLQKFTIVESIVFGWEKTIGSATMIAQSVQKLITGIVAPDQLGGVVSIVQITSQATAMGLVALLSFSALISINLGVINLLPIPALDGGHMIFTLYEMITKKEPSQTILIRLTIMGWAILFSLMALGLYNDIHRLMG